MLMHAVYPGNPRTPCLPRASMQPMLADITLSPDSRRHLVDSEANPLRNLPVTGQQDMQPSESVLTPHRMQLHPFTLFLLKSCLLSSLQRKGCSTLIP
jgi:hypothetical protein